jgi:hypothetical protein
MAQVAKDHHFVPKCYLAAFTDTGTEDGRLCVFDFEVGRFFRQRPKNVAFEKHFNRIEVEGQAPDALEKAFGEFEGQAISVIRSICRDGDLPPPDEQLSFVLNLIALLAVRNPRGRRSMTTARRHTDRIVGDFLVSDRKIYERELAAAREAGFVSGPDVTYEKMKAIARDEYTVKVPTDTHLDTELRVSQKVLTGLGARYWSILVAAPEGPDFITCDHPANLVPKQMAFPLDPRTAVAAAREDPMPRRIVVGPKGIAEVNARIVEQADRQIYSRTPDVSILYDGEVVEVSLAELSGWRAEDQVPR